ncbi:uncharacterized protein LOC131950031 [Physella acuta]|uniref:uncharacterized protein LOC131950031 n=1 Tax=Physella acuta TaxID=109671 RepID=UPI0027DC7A28|nr:uncharacterized protein LOC131950031 [Physella acuta]
MPEIALGEKFASFDSLKDAIDRYQKANKVQLIVKDSKLLGRIAKTMPKLMDVVNKDIVYYRLSYACEYHGEYRSKGKATKPNHISKRRGCAMRVLLRLAEDLHHLVVYELFEQHNHDIEPKEETKAPKQLFRMARVNSTSYTLAKLEEREGGQLVSIETSSGEQNFDDAEETDMCGGQAKMPDTPVARLIGNATKRVLTAGELRNGDFYQDLKRRKLVLVNKKLELEARKLELENKKLELELKLLEKRNEDGEQNLGGNTYYVSHVIDDKDNIADSSTAFPSTAAEVIKSLTGRGQPFQIITQ